MTNVDDHLECLPHGANVPSLQVTTLIRQLEDILCMPGICPCVLGKDSVLLCLKSLSVSFATMVQKIVTFRNFETVEDAFGKKWRTLYDQKGYRLEMEKDANLPDQVSLIRKPGPNDRYEPPLSCLGQIFARIAARRLCELGILKHRMTNQVVYSCPCLSCLQMSCALQRTLLLHKIRKIKVEPGLADFRYAMDSTDNKAEEIRRVFGIESNYQSVISKESLKMNETLDDFRERHKLVMDSIIADETAMTAIVVTHSPNVIAHIHYFSKEPLNETILKENIKFSNNVIFSRKKDDIWKWRVVQQLKLSNPKNEKFPIHLWD